MAVPMAEVSALTIEQRLGDAFDGTKIFGGPAQEDYGGNGGNGGNGGVGGGGGVDAPPPVSSSSNNGLTPDGEVVVDMQRGEQPQQQQQ